MNKIQYPLNLIITQTQNGYLVREDQASRVQEYAYARSWVARDVHDLNCILTELAAEATPLKVIT